jgi:hypothetical protein
MKPVFHCYASGVSVERLVAKEWYEHVTNEANDVAGNNCGEMMVAQYVSNFFNATSH